MKNPIPDLYQTLSLSDRRKLKKQLVENLHGDLKKSFIEHILRDRSRHFGAETARLLHDHINAILEELGAKCRLQLSELRPDIWGGVEPVKVKVS